MEQELQDKLILYEIKKLKILAKKIVGYSHLDVDFLIDLLVHLLKILIFLSMLNDNNTHYFIRTLINYNLLSRMLFFCKDG